MTSPNNIIDLAQERRSRGPRFTGDMMDILEVSRDLVCLCHSGAIAAINGAGVRLLGARSTDDLVGRRLAEFLIPDYEPVLELFLSGLASEDKPVPTRIISLDRTVKDVELQVFRARELAHDATVVVGRDISREGMLAGRAREIDARFHLLVDNGMNLVCHVMDGIIRYINAAGLGMLGAALAGQIVGRDLSSIFSPDYADLFNDPIDPALMQEGVPLPLRLRRLDGKAVDAMVKISRLPSHLGSEIMVEARDITAHNHAVVALRHAAETLEMRVAQRTREEERQRLLAEEMRSVAEARRRFIESLMETIPSPVWYKDALGRMEICNRAFRTLFGDSDYKSALPDEDRETDATLLAGHCPQVSFEAHLCLVSSKQQIDALILKTAYLDDDGHPVGIIGILTDISERKAMEQELQRMATTDPLTGILNRRHFLRSAEAEITRGIRFKHPSTLIMLDLDHFKAINDRWGHGIGDEALIALTETCRAVLREADLLGRLGGEEFAVLLPETDLAAGLKIAERLRLSITHIRLGTEESCNISASLGVASLHDGNDTVAGLLARADAAMYRAKNHGRNRVEPG